MSGCQGDVMNEKLVFHTFKILSIVCTLQQQHITKAKSNYREYDQNPAIQKFYIHFFINNFNVNVSLHTLNCPKLKFGQLKAYKLMFALELSMKK